TLFPSDDWIQAMKSLRRTAEVFKARGRGDKDLGNAAPSAPAKGPREAIDRTADCPAQPDRSIEPAKRQDLLPPVTSPGDANPIDVGSTPAPAIAQPRPVPENVQAIADPILRQRATDAWRAASQLRRLMEQWESWFHELETTGDADPGLAIRMAEAVLA